MLVQLVAALLVAAFLIGALAKWNRWSVRQRGLARLGDAKFERVSRGVDLRVLVQGSRRLASLNPNKRNRTRGDIAITDDRLLIASARGVLVDARVGQDRLTSARCTGPGRLVLEGTMPHPNGTPGQFRIETVVDNAQAWALALAPWVASGSGSVNLPRFD